MGTIDAQVKIDHHFPLGAEDEGAVGEEAHSRRESLSQSYSLAFTLHYLRSHPLTVVSFGQAK